MKPAKLLTRLLSGQLRNVRFTDFERLVEAFGFRPERVSGSHRVYGHPDHPALLNLQPFNGEAKPYQIRQFLALVEQYNLKAEPRR